MPSLFPRRLLGACALGAALAAPFWAPAPADARRLAPGAPIAVAEENAALRYYRAFLMMDERLRTRLHEAQSSLSEPVFKPSPASREAIANAQGVIRALLAGAALPSCDFGVDEIVGFNRNPPHVSAMRQGALLLLADARRRADMGETDAAAQRIAGALRMAAHLREDGMLISSMVSLATMEIAADVTERLLDAGALDDAARERIARAVDGFAEDDPFAMRTAIRREGAMWVGLFRSGADSPQRRREVASILGDGNPEQERAFLAMLADEEAPRHIDLLEAAYRQALDAWGSEDPQAALRALEDRAASGELGPIARMTLSALSRNRKNCQDSARRLEALRRRLRP